MKTLSILFIWLICVSISVVQAQQFIGNDLVNSHANRLDYGISLPDNYDLSLIEHEYYLVSDNESARVSTLDEIAEDVGPGEVTKSNDIAIDKASVSVYPIPITASFNVSYELKKTSTVSINLFDIQGKLIQALMNPTLENSGKQIHEFSIGGDLPSGMYLVQIAEAKQVIYLKALK